MLRFRHILLAYLLLLLASHAVRLANPHEVEAPAGARRAELPRVDLRADAPPGGRAGLVYRDFAAAPGAPVLVLLPGSPMRGSGWDGLAAELRGEFRLIVPELNGRSGSADDIPDCSPAAAALYVDALLDQLGIDRAHLCGFGAGGASALHFAAACPDQTASLTLLAPLAIEQLELVGDATLNRILYWAQKFYLWCGRELVPHFGALDRAAADRNYARTYHDADIRRMAAALPEVAAPTLILHGESDLVRPAASSRELARLLPQAELRLLPGGHKAPLADPAALAATLREHLAAPGPARAAATAARAAASTEPFGYQRYRADLRARVLLMVVLLAIATLISEDITCITAGILAARGMLGLFPATLGCFLGIFIGDTGLYLLGRVLGPGALRSAPLKWIVRVEKVEASERFFARYGALLVIVTRWLPGMRIPTYVAAGILKLKFRIFILYFFIAAAIWTPLLVGLSSLVGNTLLKLLARVEDHAPLVLVAVIATVLTVVHFALKRAARAFERRAERG